MTLEAAARSTVRGLGWPNASQRALLTVLVATSEHARRAWREWRRATTLTMLDVGSIRLLPLIVPRLSELGLDDPELAVFHGVLRHTWVSNQLQVRGALEAGSALVTAGIPVCALKGLGLLAHYYDGDLSRRPMYDVDLLVPRERAADALVTLLALGWSSEASITRRAFVARELDTRHAHELRRGAGSVDLHWHALPQDPSPFFARQAWAHAEPLEGFDSASGLCVLSATEKLLHVCLHGVQHDSRSNRSWALDAARILEHATRRVDFERLVQTAVQRRLCVPLEDALRFVASLGCRVPGDAIERLASEPVHPLELLEYRGVAGGWRAASADERDAMLAMRNLRGRHEHVTLEVFRSARAFAPRLGRGGRP